MEGGLYYIEMEYVDGGSLADKLKREGKLNLRAAVRMTRDVASALLAAHRKGIIHRDIKPSNVLLNKQGHIFVTDFGLAKVAQARTHLTQSGEFLGTPMYMAPEQVWAKEAGHRSDIYSLGVMFYEMLAGRPPYMADTTLGLLDQHRSAPIPDVTQANAEVPAQVGKIIQKMMAKRPEERYSSCEQVVMELNTYLETGEPGLVVDEATLRAMDEAKRSARLGKVFPKPSSPRKPLKINWRLAIPLVLVLVLVLVLGAVAVYFTRQAQRSEVRGQRLGTATTAPSVIQHPVSSIPKLNPP
jgi:serine/threonine-protein kinase